MSSPRCEKHPAMTPRRCIVCGALWCSVCCGGECPCVSLGLDYTNATRLGVWIEDEDRHRERMERRQRTFP